ncbi:MAG: hypothetical protein P1Q69_13725 [Candidatus Thorarchaeota archaeon]|nr:hypothetical protein [Candidatus Thorarchaeota archaeon]
MKRAKEHRETALSYLIPKYHFASMSFFREEPLVKWPYTKAVLFTAYDVYRSNDFWLHSLARSGQTLKEGLIELGFPKTNSLVADTGIFEIEAKKAGLAEKLGIEINFELTNNQIFEAYEMSGADFFVSPDEIILATDEDKPKRAKIEEIKSNLLDILEIVPSEKVIGVIQGVEEKYINDLFEFYRTHGVTKFAAGGILPLYRHDKDLFQQVITYVRNLTRGYWLHTFGLPDVRLLPFYLQEVRMDSIDTSMLLYMTARRRYLVGIHQRPVRLAAFEHCDCQGCATLNRQMYTRGTDFFVALYIHNISEASKVADECSKGKWAPKKDDNRILKDESLERSTAEPVYDEKPLKDKSYPDWTTAAVLFNDKE